MKLKEYNPIPGYRYQLFARNPAHGRLWESIDYATDHKDKLRLLAEYRLAFGPDWEFMTLILPRRYWAPKIPSL